MSIQAGVAVDACAPPRPPAGRRGACSTGIPRLLSTTVITWFAVDSVGSLVSRSASLLSLDPHQPADLEGVRHQWLTEFLRGARLGGFDG